MSFIVHRVAKSAARYTDAGGREKCGYCRFFMAPRACGKVVGPVSPQGWCKYFSRQVAQQYSGAGITGGGGPPGATLALDFMSSGNMPPGITFSRASTATYTDASGVIQTAAVNVPRWDYANGVLRGLLIEEARTNLLLNSATLSTQSVAVTAQAYTLSFYGAGTVTKSGAATGALVGAGAGQRVTQTFTPTAGTLTCTVTGSVTNAQIEVGGFPTSWISTAGATATRAIDLCQAPVNAGWYSGAAFSFCTEFDGPPSPWSGAMVGFSDASFGNSLYGGPDAGVNMGFSHIPSGGSSPQQAISRTGVNKVVSTFTTTRLSISSNGAVAAGAAQTATAFTVPTRLVMGNDPWSMSTAFNGHMRRVQYWPRALSDAEMQQATT